MTISSFTSEQVLPRFALDFTTAILDPSVSFTRSGATATCVNASGFIEPVAADTPRFDFNPVALTCKGLLIEKTQTNIALYSNDFRNTVTAGSTRPWVWNGTTAPDESVIAPDGASTAYKLTENNTNGSHLIQQSVTVAASFSNVLSVYAKAAGRSLIRLEIVGSGSPFPQFYSYFNLVNGTSYSSAAASGATLGQVSISDAGNGWYRCSIAGIASSATNVILRIWLVNSGANISYQGDGTSGVYLFGSQSETGDFLTSYIPTEAAAVTRNADVATITGSNFTSFWNATQGGATVQATPSNVFGIRPLIQYDDGTANEIIALRGNTTNPELYVVDGGTPQAQLDAGTIAANTAYSLTGWWATNDCRARQDSGAAVTDATATIPTVTQARIGSDGTNYLNGTIATINYYAAFSSQIYTRRKNKVFSSLF